LPYLRPPLRQDVVHAAQEVAGENAVAAASRLARHAPKASLIKK
jgi:hypothetical protein